MLIAKKAATNDNGKKITVTVAVRFTSERNIRDI